MGLGVYLHPQEPTVSGLLIVISLYGRFLWVRRALYLGMLGFKGLGYRLLAI